MKYLNFSELRKKLGGRGRSSIYRDIGAGRLPQPIKLGARLYWIECEIDKALVNRRVLGRDDDHPSSSRS